MSALPEQQEQEHEQDQACADRGITFLNEMGDIEVSWDSQNDGDMRRLVEEKIKQGYRFFILKPVLGGIVYKKTAIRSVKELRDRRVTITDPDIAHLFETGKVSLVRDNHRPETDFDLDPVKASKDANEISKRRSVAIRPLSGG